MGKRFREFFDGLGNAERRSEIELRGQYSLVGDRKWTLKEAAEGWRLAPEETIAMVAFRTLRDDSQAPGLASAHRSGPDSPLREPSLATLYPEMARPARLALSAGLLQIDDFWDASHTAAQEADDLGESRVSAYWHGIAHRREPDPGNASYWFRRVGRHPVFEPLAEAAGPLLKNAPDLAARLIPRDVWDPFAFIDVCTRASGDLAAIALRLQRIEMLLLLEMSLPG